MQAEQRNGSHSTGSMSKKMAVADQVGALKEALSLSLLKRDEEQMIEKAKSMRIPVEDVKKAQAWLLSEFPDIFQAQKGKQQGNLRLLLDENLPYSLAPALSRYGYVSSIFLKGMQGKPDYYVYQYARLRDKFNAIITRDRAQKTHRVGLRDRDLTNVTLDQYKKLFAGHEKLSDALIEQAKSLPILVHLPSPHPYRDQTVDSFEKNFSSIYKLIEHHNHAVLEVCPSGVRPKVGASLAELFLVANYQGQVGSERLIIPNPAARVIRLSNRVANGRKTNIKSVMGFVRHEVEQHYKQLVDRNQDVSQSDILSFMRDLLDRVEDTYDIPNPQEGLVILEMAIKALEKSGIDYMKLDSQNTAHDFDLT